MSMPNNVELGMLAFSNGQIRDYDADWATSGLNLLAEVISEYRYKAQKRPEFGWPLLTSNYGEEPFENDVFAMRTYCWCDGEGEHKEACPPNFEYKPTGIQISWYKHAGRGITCNLPKPSMTRWFEVLTECVASVEGEEQ